MLTERQHNNGVSKRRRRRPFWVDGIGGLAFADEEKAMAIFQPDILISDEFAATLKKNGTR